MNVADVKNKRTENNECGFNRIYDHFYAHVSHRKMRRRIKKATETEERKETNGGLEVEREDEIEREWKKTRHVFSRYYSVAIVTVCGAKHSTMALWPPRATALWRHSVDFASENIIVFFFHRFYMSHEYIHWFMLVPLILIFINIFGVRFYCVQHPSIFFFFFICDFHFQLPTIPMPNYKYKKMGEK